MDAPYTGTTTASATSRGDDDDRNNSNGRVFPSATQVPFPYSTPYPQQLHLMDALLSSLEGLAINNHERTNKHCPVFLLESPTGTGKSLSLAAACLAWLSASETRDLAGLVVDAHHNHNDNTTNTSKDNTSPSSSTGLDWVDHWTPPEERDAVERAQQVQQHATRARQLLEVQLQSRRHTVQDTNTVERNRAKRHNQLRRAVLTSRNKKQRKRRKVSTSNDNDFCLTDYTSDSDHPTKLTDSDNDTAHQPKRVTTPRELLDGARLDGSVADNNDNSKLAIGNVQPGSGIRKMIYAARTHSQLSQFVHELTRIAPTARVVHLGSRSALCTNPAVHTHKRNERALTDACLDLQQQSSKNKQAGCPFLHDDALSTLALHLCAEPTDIEESANLGKAARTCSYYASRAAVAAAQVVVLPYSMLLSSAGRAAVGLSLQENLVVVDEAHNLPEALRSLHSCTLSLPVIQAALDQLQLYLQKYVNRLAGRNLFYLGQIRKILVSFGKYLSCPVDKRGTTTTRMMTPAQLLVERKLETINLFKILRYLERSRLSQKLLGFMNHRQQLEKEEEKEAVDGLSKHISPMSIVETFLEKLTVSGTEGKVVTDWPKVNSSSADDGLSPRQSHAALRYVLLHPATFFENILEEAHALALVGGTLRPYVHVAAELIGDQGQLLQEAAMCDAKVQSALSSGSFTSISPSLTTFACDHVVSPSNVLLKTLARGSKGEVLDFRYQSRLSVSVCDALGQALVELCRVAPCGVVVFLPSYSYEAHLVRRWKATGLWKTLQSVKKLHREPKSSQHVEASLQAYSRDAEKGGAALFSVIGGKMSEGINFSNDMARCVAVVGLPYPDITDPELKEKMAALDASSDKSITGQAYYQNLCMRAVNQSVGRAIRHANDYASIVLIDKRYTTDRRIQDGLPEWLKKGDQSWRRAEPLSSCLHGMKRFFDSKKQ